MAVVAVIEDTQPLNDALAFMLSRRGHRVIQAYNGSEGLEKVNGAELILLDLLMPQTNGMDFLRAYRKSGGKAKVIVLTNVEPQEEGSLIILGNGYAEELKSLGVSDVLVKADAPIKEIVALVEKVLE